MLISSSAAIHIHDVPSLIEFHEGRRDRLYRDSSGVLTIGVGHNLEALPIPHDSIDSIFRSDLHRVEDWVRKEFPWWHDLDPPRQAVIMDMGFNLGQSSLLAFQSFLGHVAAGRYGAASREMLNSVWAFQVGRRAHRLAHMMESGEWPTS